MDVVFNSSRLTIKTQNKYSNSNLSITKYVQNKSTTEISKSNTIKNNNHQKKKCFFCRKSGIITLIVSFMIVLITILLIIRLKGKKKPKNNEEKENEKENLFNKELFEIKYKNLGHVNHIKYEIIGKTERKIPKKISNESLSNIYPKYGTQLSSSDHSTYNNSIYNENKLLIASSETYNEIDENGNLFLNNIKTNKILYKHSASIGNYYGDISDNEESVIKKISINPISKGNYITGLYAPPGEIIKYEISKEDFNLIGNQISFIIGQCTQTNIYSEHKESLNYVRMPILINELSYNKRIGYIGSFLGGPIYIKNPNKKNKFSIIISNAVPYKHLIYGITTKEEFNLMSNYTSPYFDIEIMDKSLRFSGPKIAIENLSYDNIIKSLFFWDKVHRTSKEIPHIANDNIGIHFIFDVHIAASGAAALAYIGSNWCQLPPNWASFVFDYEYITQFGAWGFIHELNHHYQKYGFSSSVQNEVTNNVISLVEYSLYSQISSNRNEFSITAITKSSYNHLYLNPEYSLSNINTNNGDFENSIMIYDVLIHMFGYELFINATKYGNGLGGIDIFFEALSETMEYDFNYYFENILGFIVSDEIKNKYINKGYPIFLPVASIYQVGRYYYKNGIEYFSNTSLPYTISNSDIPYILDFENHLIVPNGFDYEIISITNPENGTLKKISNLLYSYTKPLDNSNSGIFNLTVKLSKNGITSQTYKLGINLSVDSIHSIQIIYTYSTNLYSFITDAYENKFEGYSSVITIPNLSGSITGILENQIVIWEGKFKIEEEGYKYIVYKGGRGSSFLMVSINNKNNYQKIGFINVNQNSYQFNADAHYEKTLNKGDIIYFKLYLLATSANANLNIGISKTNEVSDVITLSQIYNINYNFNYTYDFTSGDYYPRKYIYDSSYFINYDNFEVSSPDFEPWDDSGVFTLDKIFDGLTDTYMHTKKNIIINSENPLTLIINCNNNITFNQIILKTYGANNYLPKSFTLYISDDNIKWNEIYTYNDLELDSSRTLKLNLDNKISASYIKLYIFKANPSYISIGNIEFNLPEIKYYELNPDYIQYYGDIEVNNNNFPSYGVSYILNKNDYLTMNITCSEFLIKICNSFESKVNIYIDDNIYNEYVITNKEEGYVIKVDNLEFKEHYIIVYVSEGKFDFDSVIYS